MKQINTLDELHIHPNFYPEGICLTIVQGNSTQRVVLSLGRRDRDQSVELQRLLLLCGQSYREEGPQRRNKKKLCESFAQSQLLSCTWAGQASEAQQRRLLGS